MRFLSRRRSVTVKSHRGHSFSSRRQSGTARASRARDCGVRAGGQARGTRLVRIAEVGVVRLQGEGGPSRASPPWSRTTPHRFAIVTVTCRRLCLLRCRTSHDVMLSCSQLTCSQHPPPSTKPAARATRAKGLKASSKQQAATKHQVTPPILPRYRTPVLSCSHAIIRSCSQAPIASPFPTILIGHALMLSCIQGGHSPQAF